MTQHDIQIASLPSVQAIIANTLLGPPPTPPTLGTTIHLLPHQVDAIQRIHTALKTFHGALLCDDVGLGKTYVALATALSYQRTHIVAPATLVPMWHHAIAQTDIPPTTCQITSIESLSYSPTPPTQHNNHTLLIVDEAHNIRTPNTKRYSALATLCAQSHTLLLSATPIHNSHHDLTNLIALFLGDYASHITPNELSKLLIRRTHAETNTTLPTRLPTTWLTAPTSSKLFSLIHNLPPPIPARNASATPHLSTISLIRQWTSSDHALKTAIQRRIAHATALIASLNTNRYPTKHELQRWISSDDTIQLAIPELITSNEDELNSLQLDPTQLRTSIQRHANALEHLYRQIPTPSPADQNKANIIRNIRKKHPNQRIIAFSQYTDTIRTLFQTLKNSPYTAALTSQSGLIASGPVRRQEVLQRFAPIGSNAKCPSTSQAITLLLATDLLSEGVNLQDASVVIHLDLPWTAATLDQRVGRVARIGSPHSVITIYGLRPPSNADAILRSTEILNKKSLTTLQTLGGQQPDCPTSPPAPSNPSTPDDHFNQPAKLKTTHLCTPTPHNSDRHSNTHTQTEHNPTKHHPTSLPYQTELTRAHLRRWQQPTAELPTNAHAQTPVNPTLCTSILAPHAGYIAACIINNSPTLLSSNTPSTPNTTTTTTTPTSDPNTINTLLLSIPHPPNTAHTFSPAILPHSFLEIVHALTAWHSSQQANLDAGLTSTAPPVTRTSHAKRAILRNLDHTLASTPWHQRSALAQLASQTRHTLSQPLPYAHEQLFVTQRHALPTDSNPLKSTQSHQHLIFPPQTPSPNLTFRIIAILLLIPFS